MAAKGKRDCLRWSQIRSKLRPVGYLKTDLTMDYLQRRLKRQGYRWRPDRLAVDAQRATKALPLIGFDGQSEAYKGFLQGGEKAACHPGLSPRLGAYSPQYREVGAMIITMDMG